MVKRWHVEGYEYVLAADYDALQYELDVMRDASDRLAKQHAALLALVAEIRARLGKEVA